MESTIIRKALEEAGPVDRQVIRLSERPDTEASLLKFAERVVKLARIGVRA